MIFGMHVHDSPSYYLHRLVPVIARRIQARLEGGTFGELDGLYVSFQTTGAVPSGMKTRTRKVRRNYTRKLMTGGSIHYHCVVEYEGLVSLGETMALQTEDEMERYVMSLLTRVFPSLVRGIEIENLEQLRAAVCDAV